MKFHQSIFQSNNLKIIKYLAFVTLIFLLSFKVNTEIPEKYKIESSLAKCKGTDYTKWTNCYGEFKFPRIEYKGEWKNGEFHGKGVLREAWGAIYKGDFKNNMADGHGKQEEKDGGWFEGEVKNDLLNGKGVYVTSSGNRYEGNFVDHLLEGQGVFSKPDGTRASGEFKKDLLNGKGKWEYANGNFYEGDFKDDEAHGFGIFVWKDGDRYEGEYIDGYRSGKGKIVYTNGDIFEGEWKDGDKHGKGKIVYANGDIYDGEYEMGFKTGKGTLIWVSGAKYEGDFLEGLKNGNGIFTFESGNKYIGEYLNDEAHGKGTFIWVDGAKYEGEWENGYRSGKGKYLYESGTVYEGEFKFNKSEGFGTIIYEDGTKYVGEFKDDWEHGEGTAEYENGDKYVGQFDDGYRHGKGKMVYANGDVEEGLWKEGKFAEGETTLAKFTTDEKYYALIIGNNNYDHLEKLDAAENDAVEIEKVLKEKYGFETTLLLSANYSKTADAIIKFTKNRKKNDNLLIYYAGHGKLIKDEDRGYWLPTDAGEEQDSKWLGNDSIKNWIRSSKAKHILLIVDSCFAGSLMRGGNENKSIEKLNQNSIERLQKKKTRIVWTSGGNEPVVDSDGGEHSFFAEKLIKILKNNNDVAISLKLFQEVRQFVIDNAQQTPEHSMIHGTGHDGGDFLFFPKS